MFGQDFGIEAGKFLAGEGVENAAHRVDLFGDLLGAAALRAFEKHVFDEVGNPVFFRMFIPRSRLHPDPYGNGMDPRDFLRDDLDSIVKGCFLYHFGFAQRLVPIF